MLLADASTHPGAMFFRDEKLMEVMNERPEHHGRRDARPDGKFSGLVEEETIREIFKALDDPDLDVVASAVDELQDMSPNTYLVSDFNQVEGGLEALERTVKRFEEDPDYKRIYASIAQSLINTMLNKPYSGEESVIGSWYPGKYYPELGRAIEGYNPAFPEHLQPWGLPNGEKPVSRPGRKE